MPAADGGLEQPPLLPPRHISSPIESRDAMAPRSKSSGVREGRMEVVHHHHRRRRRLLGKIRHCRLRARSEGRRSSDVHVHLRLVDGLGLEELVL